MLGTVLFAGWPSVLIFRTIARGRLNLILKDAKESLLQLF